MRTAALLTRDAKLAERLRRLLEGALHLVQGATLPAAPDRGPALPIDLILIDLASTWLSAAELTAIRGRHPDTVLVGLLPPQAAEEPLAVGAEHCELLVPTDIPDGLLRLGIDQALRVQRLGQEVASLRRERRRVEPAPAAPEAASSGAAFGSVLKELGKLVATHFDLDRVVDLFLDAITELVRPGRAALLLADEEGRFGVRGHRGLDAAVVRQLRLDEADGLPAWFRRLARPARRGELERDPEWLDAVRELAALGAEVAVPLWVQAKLVGVLALGPRVTGQPYTGEDLERLFTLASQVAMAVEDIRLFDTVRAQHTFIEQVLAHLQSGAVTIDTAGRVTLFNHRAEELLGLPRDEVLGRDLRALPSPLGDLLFETLRHGQERRLHEVTLPRRPSAPLEVSTSRIHGADGDAAGAVMILDDPAPRHLLQRERETTQTLDLLNRVLLRLTDEIKNPLVSIYTFLELLPQRYDDPEFRERFFSVVGRDTKHLISLVDKLIILAGEREYKLDFCDMRELVNQALGDLALRLERPRAAQDATIFLLEVPDRKSRLTAVLYAPAADLTVRADRDQLGKALGYLIRFLMARVEPDGRLAIHVLTDADDVRTVRMSLVGRPATLPATERERLFSPLAIASERLLDVGPSVSQKIVEAHGGRLAVGGSEGEIRFVLTLPRTPQ
jgi:PAS domain S-box-containing protein